MGNGGTTSIEQEVTHAPNAIGRSKAVPGNTKWYCS